MSPPRSLSELEDVSDTTSSLGSGDWTDLSSAHPDDVSDNASADGSEQPRPVSVAGNINDGSEEAWTTAEALSSSSASLYASVHAPLNPFESDGESERSDKSIRPAPYGTFGPLDPFHSESGSERSEPHQELQLILPDPLERSSSTVAADVLSFSDDAVLATNPTAVVSLAGAHPSIAQRTVVVTDVLAAIARATHSSLVRADYYNFTSLSDLPTRVPNHSAPAKEISVLVRDHTDEPLTNSLDSTPSILVVFTSDAQESTVPSIHKHSILIPVVLSESRPVVLFDERDDRLPDESSVDIEELVRQLSNLFTFERDSVATTQTAIEDVNQPEHDDKPSNSDVRTLDLDLGVHSLDAFDSDAKSVEHPAPEDTLVPDSGANVDEKPHKPVVRKRQPLDRIVGSERADAFRKFHANMGPGLTAACALAVVLSLVLGTNRLIQSSKAPFPNKTPGSINILPVSSHGVNTIPIDQPSVTGTSLTSNLPHSSLAVKSPHMSLALKSPHTALATKSPHTSLAVKSQHTSVAVRSSTTSSLVVKSQHTHLSVHAPVNVSCSTVPVSVSASTSLSTTVVSTSLSTTTPSPSPASSSTDAKTRILNEVAEELGNAIERIERAIGLNLRRNTDAALKVLESVRKSSAVCKASDKADAVLDAVNRANEAIKAASGIDTAETLKTARGELHGRHQVARRTAQRQLASLKRGVGSLVWGEDAIKEYVKGKGKEKGEESVNETEKKTPKAKGKAKEKLRPGREKWHTSRDHRGFRSERIAKKDKSKEGSEKKAKGCVKCGEKSKGKVPFPSREEREKAQTAGRGKRPTSKDKSRHQDEEWVWTWEGDYEYEYPFGYGPRAVVEEVVEEVREFFSF